MNAAAINDNDGMDDPNYGAIASFVHSYEGFDSPDEPCIRIAWEAFEGNISRIFALCKIPAIVAAHVLHADRLNNGENLKASAFTDGCNVVDRHISIPAMQVGTSALYATMIIGVWSAFETLAGDMWISALLSRPQLAGLIPLDRPSLEKHVRSKMSGLQGKKDGIVNQYTATFADHVPPLLARPDFSNLFVVVAIRNRLVHSAGIVTGDFVTAATDHSRAFSDFGLSSLAVGNTIQMTGNLVHRCINTTVNAAMQLMYFVDEWFADHP